MAFQNVNQGKFVQGTAMKEGEVYEGYVLGFQKSQQYEAINVIMQNAETGDRELFFTAGNLKYIVQDGKLITGQLTRITRLADKSVKGKKSSQFLVEQDADDTVGAEAYANIPALDMTPKKTIDANKVKAAAEALTAQATAGKRG